MSHKLMYFLFLRLTFNAVFGELILEDYYISCTDEPTPTPVLPLYVPPHAPDTLPEPFTDFQIQYPDFFY